MNEPEILVVAVTNRPTATTCPVCGDGVTHGVMVCDRCGTPHHEDCWRYVGHCAMFGCAPQSPLRPRTAEFERVKRSVDDWLAITRSYAVTLWLLATGLAVAGLCGAYFAAGAGGGDEDIFSEIFGIGLMTSTALVIMSFIVLAIFGAHRHRHRHLEQRARDELERLSAVGASLPSNLLRASFGKELVWLIERFRAVVAGGVLALLGVLVLIHQHAVPVVYHLLRPSLTTWLLCLGSLVAALLVSNHALRRMATVRSLVIRFAASEWPLADSVDDVTFLPADGE